MDPPEYPDDWETITSEQLHMIRARFAAYTETIVDPKKRGSRRQLVAIQTPLEAVQDSIIMMNDVVIE
jgi:hypothetical protein